mmetsp:Transcript_46800/g.100783  ORF Transcript_46800/g.100783 Transcript_46800/m.100783 type:complete len:249 (-) Transcript_46800:209-955(-)
MPLEARVVELPEEFSTLFHDFWLEGFFLSLLMVGKFHVRHHAYQSARGRNLRTILPGLDVLALDHLSRLIEEFRLQGHLFGMLLLLKLGVLVDSLFAPLKVLFSPVQYLLIGLLEVVVWQRPTCFLGKNIVHCVHVKKVVVNHIGTLQFPRPLWPHVERNSFPHFLDLPRPGHMGHCGMVLRCAADKICHREMGFVWVVGQGPKRCSQVALRVGFCPWTSVPLQGRFELSECDEAILVVVNRVERIPK